MLLFGRCHGLAPSAGLHSSLSCLPVGSDSLSLLGITPPASPIVDAPPPPPPPQVLRVIKEEGIQERAARVGAHLERRLLQLATKHDVIGDVRGAGLMLGVEMVKDRATKARPLIILAPHAMLSTSGAACPRPPARLTPTNVHTHARSHTPTQTHDTLTHTPAHARTHSQTRNALLQAPATEETARVFERCKDLGVLLGKGGLHGSVFRIKPPMCLGEDDADVIVDVLGTALSEL